MAKIEETEEAWEVVLFDIEGNRVGLGCAISRRPADLL